MFGICHALARRLTWESGVENCSEMMPATGVMSASGVVSTTTSPGSNVSSDSATPSGTSRSLPIALPWLNAT